MMLNPSSERRAVLRALASALLLPTSLGAFARPRDAGAQDKPGTDKGDAGKARPGKADGQPSKATDDEKGAKADAKKGKSALLTVVVMGDGKPVRQAEVVVTFPTGAGGELTLPTGQDGEATFKSAGLGTAKVRVIATGWGSVLKEIALKEGPQRLTITLNSLTQTKPPAGGKPPSDGKQ